MQLLSPPDQDFVKTITDIGARVRNLEHRRQIYWGDWFDFNPAEFTRSTGSNNAWVSPTYHYFTWAQSTIGKMAVGDRMRWKINGATDYTYAAILALSGNDIHCSEDIPSGSIDEISWSRHPSPTGWPDRFENDSILFSGTESLNIASTPATVPYRIDTNGVITLYTHPLFKFTIVSGTGEIIEMDIPFYYGFVKAGLAEFGTGGATSDFRRYNFGTFDYATRFGTPTVNSGLAFIDLTMDSDEAVWNFVGGEEGDYYLKQYVPLILTPPS